MTSLRKLGLRSLVWAGAIASSAVFSGLAPTMVKAADSGTQASPTAAQNRLAQNTTQVPGVWRAATSEEEQQTWDYILNSPLGIAALNQLAIEGFINPLCEKTLYSHQQYGGFQTLLQVTCPTPRGVSTARSYSEMRVVLNRFEDTIINFSVERIYEDN
ncbi:MAG TPA: hypothetical protein V6D29_09845 [Leptolyngbyaceae cyanobacterium]